MENAIVNSSEIVSSSNGLPPVVQEDAVCDQAIHQAEVADGPWYALACRLPGDLLAQVLAYSGVSPFCKGWVPAFKAVAADPQLQATWFTSHHPNIDEALAPAAGYGATGTVQLLLDRGADVRAPSKDGRNTPLSMAAAMGQIHTLRLLMDRGADVSADGKQALLMAARNGHAEVARLLLASGVSVNWAFILEAMQGKVASVRLLMDAVTDSLLGVIAIALTAAAGEGHEDMACFLLSCDHEGTERVNAGWHAQILDSEVGPMALHLAATRGHEAMARLLMNRGVDVLKALAHANTPQPSLLDALDILSQIRADLCATAPQLHG